MSTKNADLVRRWFREVWNEARADAIDEMFPPEGIAHGIGMKDLRGPAEFRAFQAEALAAYPGWKFTVDDTICHGDRVAARMTGRFTRNGVEVVASVACFFRIRRGKILEAWNTWDRLGVLQQLDALPAGAGKHLTPRML